MPDVTISLTAPQAARLQAAFQLRYPGATVDIPFVKQWLIARLKDMVIDEERANAVRIAQQSHIDSPFDPA